MLWRWMSTTCTDHHLWLINCRMYTIFSTSCVLHEIVIWHSNLSFLMKVIPETSLRTKLDNLFFFNTNNINDELCILERTSIWTFNFLVSVHDNKGYDLNFAHIGTNYGCIIWYLWQLGMPVSSIITFSHKTMFGSSLPLVVCKGTHVLFTLLVFVRFVFTSSCL